MADQDEKKNIPTGEDAQKFQKIVQNEIKSVGDASFRWYGIYQLIKELKQNLKTRLKDGELKKGDLDYAITADMLKSWEDDQKKWQRVLKTNYNNISQILGKKGVTAEEIEDEDFLVMLSFGHQNENVNVYLERLSHLDTATDEILKCKSNKTHFFCGTTLDMDAALCEHATFFRYNYSMAKKRVYCSLRCCTTDQDNTFVMDEDQDDAQEMTQELGQVTL